MIQLKHFISPGSMLRRFMSLQTCSASFSCRSTSFSIPRISHRWYCEKEVPWVPTPRDFSRVMKMFPGCRFPDLSNPDDPPTINTFRYVFQKLEEIGDVAQFEAHWKMMKVLPTNPLSPDMQCYLIGAKLYHKIDMKTTRNKYIAWLIEYANETTLTAPDLLWLSSVCLEGQLTDTAHALYFLGTKNDIIMPIEQQIELLRQLLALKRQNCLLLLDSIRSRTIIDELLYDEFLSLCRSPLIRQEVLQAKESDEFLRIHVQKFGSLEWNLSNTRVIQ